MTTRRKRTKGNKLWSVTRISHPAHPRHTLRVTELRPGGPLYYVWWESGTQRMATMRCTRAELGATPKKQQEAARARACELIEKRATGTATNRTSADGATLTLGALADAYAERGFFGRSPRYQKEQSRRVRRVAAFVGEGRAVASLRPSDVKQYGAQRQRQGVRQRTARGDLVAVKIACSWAVGEGLLCDSPFARIKLDRMQQEPRRPWVSVERYEALKAVAGQLPPGFGVLLDLAWGTGHRIGAILALRWDDVSFDLTGDAPHGSIRWRAESDKMRREHTLPMNSLVKGALDGWREQRPGIGGAWIFPAPKDGHQPLNRGVAGHWLTRAEKLAQLAHMPAGGFHAFRRGWASARKHLPLKDVAAAGGWCDEATMMKCYTRADAATTRDVIEHIA